MQLSKVSNFFKTLLNWNSAGKAFLDLVLICFFTMLASILTLISMLVKSDGVINWAQLYNNGNFFLYAISLFSSSLIYYLHKKDRLFGKYFVMILIVICAITYSQFINDQKSTTLFTQYGSLVVVAISAFVFIITQYYQHLIMLDMNEVDRNNQKEIAEGVTF